MLINYEKIEQSEQVRICDFMNGACYVLDGSVKRISAKMVLYVPNGVSIEENYSNKIKKRHLWKWKFMKLIIFIDVFLF